MPKQSQSKKLAKKEIFSETTCDISQHFVSRQLLPQRDSFIAETSMIRMLRHLSIILMVMSYGAIASAQEYYVDITNRTGFTIFYMYVSPAASDSWEEDVLGNEILNSGDTKRVWLRGYKSPIFDIRLVDSDGDSYTFWKVDVSKNDITVRLTDIDK